MLSYQWGSAYGCMPDIPWLAGDTRALATCALGLTRPRTLPISARHPSRPPIATHSVTLRIFHPTFTFHANYAR